MWNSEKTGCWLTVIPMLVFDCVALQVSKGNSGLLFSEFFSEIFCPKCYLINCVDVNSIEVSSISYKNQLSYH